MAERAKITCRGCSHICHAVPVTINQISLAMERGEKTLISQLESFVLLKTFFVFCQQDKSYFSVKWR